MKTEFSPLAISDLKDIRDYIALDSPETADKYLLKLHQRALSIADFPSTGLDLSKKIRAKVKYKYVIIDDYLIFYLLTDESVRIIRVLHGSRDIKKIFQS